MNYFSTLVCLYNDIFAVLQFYLAKVIIMKTLADIERRSYEKSKE